MARLLETRLAGSIAFQCLGESNQAVVRLWRALGFRITGNVLGAFAHPTLGRGGLHLIHIRLRRVD